MKPQDIYQLLDKYNLKAKKYLGQNFLCDQNYIDKIIDSAEITTGSGVIEIGPGLGSLTRSLVLKAKTVLCYEIDENLSSVLKSNLKNDNLHIINDDFLKSKVADDINTYFKDHKEIIIVANLPYYITTAILIKILEERLPITRMIVMMQKEVANRLTGIPQTKDYNSLSVLIQYYTVVNKLFDVNPEAFIPRPEVTSSVVLIEKKVDIFPKALSEEFFLRFNRIIFEQRRKTLVNNLLGKVSLDKNTLMKTLAENGYRVDVRAEALSVSEIVRLSDIIYQLLKDK